MIEQLQFEDEEINIVLRRGWDSALRSLASRVSKPAFETHIRAIRPLSITEEKADDGRPFSRVSLGVPSAFTREWIEPRHGGAIAAALEEALQCDVRLRFVIQAGVSGPAAAPGGAERSRSMARSGESSGGRQPARSAANGNGSEGSSSRKRSAKPESSSRGNSEAAAESDAPDSLIPRYTFDAFVVGQSNRLAHAGASAVAQSPGTVYNPLFLYGPPGLGKTHLMHAIGNEIVRARGGDGGRVAYVSGEAFTTDFITSLRERRNEEFRRRWRSVDVWLVDDVQFIAGKESTKEEFFHTFNTLYQSGRQIVISSDRSPRELRTMDERLRSRFESGLIADLAPPDLETRLAILQRKSQSERANIPDDVLLYMAKLVRSNIRTLEGALVRLMAYASLINTPVTKALAASVLERYYVQTGIVPGPEESSPGSGRSAGDSYDSLPEDEGASMDDTRLIDSVPASVGGGLHAYTGLGTISPEVVQRVVARRFGLTTEALNGRKRDKEVVAARQVAMHLMREMTAMSLPGIGQFFGGRDHTTVLYACDKMRTQISIDDDLRRLVEDLTIQLRATQHAAE